MKSRFVLAVLVLFAVPVAASAQPARQSHRQASPSLLALALEFLGVKGVVVVPPPPPPKPPRMTADGGTCLDPNGGCLPPKP